MTAYVLFHLPIRTTGHHLGSRYLFVGVDMGVGRYHDGIYVEESKI